MTEPLDPMTQLQQAATQVHELFLAYVAAGFTEPQALQLVCSTIAAYVRPPS